MRRSKANEFSGRYDLGFLPESREMPLIACDQIVRTGSIGALKEHVVVGVACDIQAAGRDDRIAVVLMSCSNCCLRPLRIRSSGRPRTLLYSSRMGRDTYKRAGRVMASSKTVRCSPAGLIAAEIRIFVSITRRSGSITASASGTGKSL